MFRQFFPTVHRLTFSTGGQGVQALKPVVAASVFRANTVALTAWAESLRRKRGKYELRGGQAFTKVRDFV